MKKGILIVGEQGSRKSRLLNALLMPSKNAIKIDAVEFLSFDKKTRSNIVESCDIVGIEEVTTNEQLQRVSDIFENSNSAPVVSTQIEIWQLAEFVFQSFRILDIRELFAQ